MDHVAILASGLVSAKVAELVIAAENAGAVAWIATMDVVALGTGDIGSEFDTIQLGEEVTKCRGRVGDVKLRPIVGPLDFRLRTEAEREGGEEREEGHVGAADLVRLLVLCGPFTTRISWALQPKITCLTNPYRKEKHETEELRVHPSPACA